MEDSRGQQLAKTSANLTEDFHGQHLARTSAKLTEDFRGQHLARTSASLTEDFCGQHLTSSRDVAWSRWSYKKKCSDPSHVFHIAFQGVSLEPFSKKVMVPHYSQTADSLSPANSRKILKNRVLQMYNTVIRCYDISPHS